jgi:hypothetical protein
MHIQEASYALRASSPTVAAEELRLIKDLRDTKQIINFPKDLLINDVISFAKGEELKSPFIANVIDLDKEFSTSDDTTERKKVLDETDDHNAKFLKETTDGKENDKAIALEEFDNKKPSFEDFYERKIEQRIFATVERVERETNSEGLVQKCKELGMRRMINIPSIALAEGASLSYQDARIFEELSEKQKKRLGDANDRLLMCSSRMIKILRFGLNESLIRGSKS